MAPDFAYEIAMNEDLDTKVNIGLKNATFSGTVKVQASDGTTYTVDQLSEAGYSQDTIDQIKELENNAGTIETKTPYIKTVEHHWFRNVYFDTEGKSVEYAVVDEESKEDDDADSDSDEEDEDLSDEEKAAKEYDDEPEDTQYIYDEIDGQKVLRTTNGAIDVYETADSTETFEYTGDEIEGLNSGDKIIYQGSIANRITQKEDGVRGVTNPTTKELFKGEYYIYDGTIEKADNIKEGKEEKQQIQFNDNSLSAFSILEHETSIDSQLIYRDLKELLVELDYFDYSDFEEGKHRLLEWPIPEYKHYDWPVRKYEKQILEYGTLILSKSSVDKIKEEEAKKEEELTNEATQNAESNNDPINSDQESDSDVSVSTDDTDVDVSVEQILTEAKELKEQFNREGWTYHNGNSIPLSNAAKGVDCSAFVCQVLYNCGFTDLGGHQKSCSGGSLPAYCEEKGWEKIESTSELEAGDIIFTGQNESGNPTHTFIYITDSTSYDCGSTSNIQSVVNSYSFSGYDFRYAYRVETTTSKLVGFEPGQDVIAMGDCKVIDEVNTIEYGPGIKVELTGDTILKGYELIMAGFDISVSKGDELKMKDVIGTTTEDNIGLILIDLEKAKVENIEDYVRIPKKGGTLDDEKFLYWMGIVLEGGQLDASGTMSVPVNLSDGAGSTHYFGLTRYETDLARELGYNIDWNSNIPLQTLVDIYLALIEEEKEYIKSELGEDIDDGYLQAFMSIKHNYGNLTSRGDEYKASGSVSESTWCTYEGTQYAEALTNRRIAEWKLITEGKYYNPYDGLVEVTFESETPFTDWCEEHGVTNIQVPESD